MNPSKRKGTAFESAVVAHFNGHGFPNVERRALAGTLDRGDLSGVPDFVVECKATKAIELGTSMAEAEREARNAGLRNHLLVIKRRQRSTADAYGVMPLWLCVDLIKSRDVVDVGPTDWLGLS